LATVLSRMVEVCIFRRSRGKTQYLLLQRADDEELYPGIWQIVTGSLKKKERAEKAALRELKEETGLKLKRFWTVPFLDSYFDIKKDAVQMVPIFAAEIDMMLSVHLSHEHQRFEWLAYEEARERIAWPGQRKAIKIVHDYIANGKEAARMLEIMKF
jgi:dihydroneopterin triphosphate diphosphatase